ncbi:scrib [Scenedesmus sp. PABB004]|nr:scrib [Scenedesmus sp. PABB004]
MAGSDDSGADAPAPAPARLDLARLRLCALPPLQGCCEGAEALSLARNRLALGAADFAAISAAAPRLLALDASRNPLTSLEGVGALSALTSLDVHGCAGLGDLAPVAGLPQLQELNAAACALVRLPLELASLSRLTALNLARNGLTDLPPPDALPPSLARLSLARNLLAAPSALAPLRGLRRLLDLAVDGNPLQLQLAGQGGATAREQVLAWCPASLLTLDMQHVSAGERGLLLTQAMRAGVGASAGAGELGGAPAPVAAGAPGGGPLLAPGAELDAVLRGAAVACGVLPPPGRAAGPAPDGAQGAAVEGSDELEGGGWWVDDGGDLHSASEAARCLAVTRAHLCQRSAARSASPPSPATPGVVRCGDALVLTGAEGLAALRSEAAAGVGDLTLKGTSYDEVLDALPVLRGLSLTSLTLAGQAGLDSLPQLHAFLQLPRLRHLAVECSEVCGLTLLRPYVAFRFTSLETFQCVPVTRDEVQAAAQLFGPLDAALAAALRQAPQQAALAASGVLKGAPPALAALATGGGDDAAAVGAALAVTAGRPLLPSRRAADAGRALAARIMDEAAAVQAGLEQLHESWSGLVEGAVALGRR